MNQEEELIKEQTCKYEEVSKIIFSSDKEKVSRGDFNIQKVLGRGADGKVFLCTHNKNPEKLLAMKVVKKCHIIKKNQLEHTIAENLILKYL